LEGKLGIERGVEGQGEAKAFKIFRTNKDKNETMMMTVGTTMTFNNE